MPTYGPHQPLAKALKGPAFAPAFAGQLLALFQVLIEVVIEFADRGGFEHQHDDFIVFAHGALVEVGRSDAGQTGINGHCLDVEHCGLVAVYLNATPQKLRDIIFRRELRNPFIVVLSRHHDLHLDAALGGRDQERAHLGIWNKIG